MFYPLLEFGSLPFVVLSMFFVWCELWLFAYLDDKREGSSSSASAIILALIVAIVSVVTVSGFPILSWKYGVAYACFGLAWMLTYWYCVLRYNAHMLRKVRRGYRYKYGTEVWVDDRLAHYLPDSPANHQLRAQALLWPIGIASFAVRNGTSGIISLFEGSFESIRQAFRFVPPDETRD